MATLGVLESLAGSGSTGDVTKLGRPEESDNEVDDFPVMWAAPGTLARTLPWQLDPGRRPDTDRTHMVVTDRRVLVLGLLNDSDDPYDEVLWETDRAAVAVVRRKRFSKYDTDFTVTFTDGSWCRLAGWNSNCRDDVTRALENPLPLVPLDKLTPGQKRTVRKLLKGKEPGGGLHVYRRPSGNFYVEYLPTDHIDPDYGMGSESFCLMGPDGEDVTYRKGDI